MIRHYAPVAVGILLLIIIAGYGILYASGRLTMPQATEQPMQVCVEAQSGAVGESCSKED